MTPPRPPRAVLDTDVIFSRVLHELLGRIASELRLLTPIWSDELLTEAERVLVEKKPMPEAAARRWVGYLREAFPAGRVELAGPPWAAQLAELTADPDDQHICALAVAGNADLLLTSDRGYLRDPLSRHGIDVQVPDGFLGAAFDEQPSALLGLLRSQAAAWGGGRPIEELLDAIQRGGAWSFADKARRALAA